MMKRIRFFSYCSILMVMASIAGASELEHGSLPGAYFEYGWSDCDNGYDTEINGGYVPGPGESCLMTVHGKSLHVTHFDSVFNCCIDAIDLEVDIQDDSIVIHEFETWTYPCYCYCYFDVDIDVFNLLPGRYSVEVWSHWMNGDESVRCQDQITIPGRIFPALQHAR